MLLSILAFIGNSGNEIRQFSAYYNYILIRKCVMYLPKVYFSGAEDRHGYIWDRHYGICIAKLVHSDVVNSVAFNPLNAEMLITTSDDFEIRVWRSRNFCEQHNVKIKVPEQYQQCVLNKRSR